MEMLLFLVLCVGLAWLVRSQENEAQTVMQQDDGHARSPSEPDEGGELEIRWVPPAKDVAPACGRTVPTDTATPRIYARRSDERRVGTECVLTFRSWLWPYH